MTPKQQIILILAILFVCLLLVNFAKEAYAQEAQSTVIRDFTIPQGEYVEWLNTDNVAHAPTSGNPYDGPSGLFAIAPIQPNQAYELFFDEIGTIEYFCMIHPWENGIITVNPIIEESHVGESLQQQSTKIPEWVKVIFEAWIDNRITENELISAIKFLVETGVIPVN